LLSSYTVYVLQILRHEGAKSRKKNYQNKVTARQGLQRLE